jgi:hypothetical protein
MKWEILLLAQKYSIAGKTTVTDNNGDFSLDLPSGLYNMTVKAPKYNTLRVEKLSVVIKKTLSRLH